MGTEYHQCNMYSIVVYSKNILLNRNKVVRVGYWWFDFLMIWKWRYVYYNKNEYVWTTIYNGRKRIHGHIRMHRLIKGYKQGYGVNHIDKNGLNNHEENLRFANRRQLNMTRNGSGYSKYLGVSFCNGKHPRFRATIRVNGKNKNLGSFTHDHKGEIEAAMAYDKEAIIQHGEFANLNFPIVYR